MAVAHLLTKPLANWIWAIWTGAMGNNSRGFHTDRAVTLADCYP